MTELAAISTAILLAATFVSAPAPVRDHSGEDAPPALVVTFRQPLVAGAWSTFDGPGDVKVEDATISPGTPPREPIPQDVMVDRARDVNARIEGYDRDRLSFEQIWHTWPQTQEYLLARARTRHHLRPPEPLHRTA